MLYQEGHSPLLARKTTVGSIRAESDNVNDTLVSSVFNLALSELRDVFMKFVTLLIDATAVESRMYITAYLNMRYVICISNGMYIYNNKNVVQTY